MLNRRPRTPGPTPHTTKKGPCLGVDSSCPSGAGSLFSWAWAVRPWKALPSQPSLGGWGSSRLDVKGEGGDPQRGGGGGGGGGGGTAPAALGTLRAAEAPRTPPLPPCSPPSPHAPPSPLPPPRRTAAGRRASPETPAGAGGCPPRRRRLWGRASGGQAPALRVEPSAGVRRPSRVPEGRAGGRARTTSLVGGGPAFGGGVGRP